MYSLFVKCMQINCIDVSAINKKKPTELKM